MNKIIEYIKTIRKTFLIKVCYYLIPLVLILGCTHSCKANQGLIETLNQHQQVLSLIQDSILGNANESLNKSHQDSLTKAIKQIINPHYINNNSIKTESDQRNVMVVATLNLQQEELLKDFKEISKEIQSYGKLFFDGNTVTFLITLIVTLLLTLFFESQKAMRELIDKTKDTPKEQEKLMKETADQLNTLKHNMNLIQEMSMKKTTDDLNTLTHNMDLYVRIYALHNTSITIRQFLALYLSQQSNIELLPELVYQAANSIDDIKYLLKDKFIVKKDIFNMMYKTLSSTYQNLEHKKLEVVPEYEDIKALLTDVTDDIKDLQQKIEEHKEKDNQNTAA